MEEMIEPYRSLDRVKPLAGHWFSPDTLRFFGSRVGDRLYRGAFFVTSDLTGPAECDDTYRVYSVRRVHTKADGFVTISTVDGPSVDRRGMYGGWKSLSGANGAARRIADRVADGDECPCQRCRGERRSS